MYFCIKCSSLAFSVIFFYVKYNNSIYFKRVYCSEKRYRYTLNIKYIKRIYQMSYSLLSDNGMLQIFSFLTNDYKKLFKAVPAYSWPFTYFRKYRDLRKIV